MNIVFNWSDISACFFASSISLFFSSRRFACKLLYLLYIIRHNKKKARNDRATTTMAVNLVSSTFSLMYDSLSFSIPRLSRLA